MIEYKKDGSIEVVCGPMFAGKTEELIRRINRLTFSKKKFLVFNPKIDTRYSKKQDKIISHSKLNADAIFINNSKEILNYLNKDLDAVIIDEAQFFDNNIVSVCKQLQKNNVRVIVGGLDLDFRGDPFGPMPNLLAIAEDVLKLTAICEKCGNPATKSQRIINGKPAKYNDDLVLIGAVESYEPRCSSCHQIDK